MQRVLPNAFPLFPFPPFPDLIPKHTLLLLPVVTLTFIVVIVLILKSFLLAATSVSFRQVAVWSHKNVSADTLLSHTVTASPFLQLK